MPMKPRKGIDEREPQNYQNMRLDSLTVAYELWLLVSTASDHGKARDQITRNIYVESFGIHCRALLFFLYAHLDRADPLPWFTGQAKPTDVLAIDFAEQWKTASGDPPEFLRHAKERADKEVAHITHQRRGLNQPGSVNTSDWNITEECTAICNAFARWLQIVEPNKIDPDALAQMQHDLNAWFKPIPSAASNRPTQSAVSLQAKTTARTFITSPKFGLGGTH